MCTYQPICYWVRVNEDGTQNKYKNVGSELKKKHFQDDDMFGTRQLKDLKLSQMIFIEQLGIEEALQLGNTNHGCSAPHCHVLH